MADITVTRNDVDSRYEAQLGGDTALIAYRVLPGDPTVLDLLHTEVPDSMQGQGVGGQLVRQALDDIRSRGERIRPTCPFVSRWLESHEDYADLVAAR